MRYFQSFLVRHYSVFAHQAFSLQVVAKATVGMIKSSQTIMYSSRPFIFAPETYVHFIKFWLIVVMRGIIGGTEKIVCESRVMLPIAIYGMEQT